MIKKMYKFKRILCITMAGAMVFTASPMQSFAANGESVNKVIANEAVMITPENRIDTLILKINNSFMKLKPQSGIDTNINDVMNTWIAAQEGCEGITAQLKTSSDEDYIASDGTINYYKDFKLPCYMHQKNVSTVFTLTCDGAQKDTGNITAMVGWDSDKMSAKMQEEAALLNEDIIKGSNENLTSIENDLTLPQIMGAGANKVWSQISWESSNEDVISVIQGDEYGAITAPRIGKVTRPEADTKVTLTATFNCYSGIVNTAIDNIPSFTKSFDVVVKGTGSMEEVKAAKKAEMQSLLDTYYTDDALKDFVSGEKINSSNVTGDILLPNPSRLNKDFKYKEFKVTSSDPSVININYLHAFVDIFGDSDKDVTLTVTYTKDDISVSKDIHIHVKMINEADLDKEIELMEAAKAHYFDGLNKGQYNSINEVTGNLNAFQEVNFNEDGNLSFVYNTADRTGKGIITTDINPDDQMGLSGYYRFKSSDTGICSHENLLIVRPEHDTQITISSVLTSERYGELCKNHPDNEKLQKIYRQPVQVTLTVKGTNEGGEVVTDSSVNANVSAQTSNTYLYPYTNINIKAGLAKEYGYSYATGVKSTEVTTLDALVALHIQLFDDGFTKETAGEYLEVSSAGTITKIFGMATMSVGFTVNGESPHDNVMTSYGYTGYTVNQAVVPEGADVEFLMYQDQDMFMDYYTWFNMDGRKASEIAAVEGKEFKLQVKGYMLAWGAFYDDDNKKGVKPMQDVQLVSVDEYGNTTPIEGCMTDKNGEVTLKFDKAGTYRIAAKGTSESEYIFMPYATVNVRELNDDEKAEIEKEKAKAKEQFNNTLTGIVEEAKTGLDNVSDSFLDDLFSIFNMIMFG